MAAGAAPLAAPSFDHAAGDPVPDDIRIETPAAGGPRFVLVEGNYLFLDEPPWDAVRRHCAERWVMDVAPARAMARIVRRHEAVGATRAEAEARAASSDALNAELVWAGRTRCRPHVAVPSFDEA